MYKENIKCNYTHYIVPILIGLTSLCLLQVYIHDCCTVGSSIPSINYRKLFINFNDKTNSTYNNDSGYYNNRAMATAIKKKKFNLIISVVETCGYV